MPTVRRLVVGLLLAAAPALAQTPSTSYWLIGRVSGEWEYREGNAKERKLTEQYDFLRPTGEVRCLEKELKNCQLLYLASSRSDTLQKLAVPLKQSGAWVSLRGLPPPPPPALPVTSKQLIDKLLVFTKPGGSRAASGCGGNFPLSAPACGENIDPGEFKIRWQPPAEGSAGRLLVMFQRADGNSPLSRDAAPVASGEFSSTLLTEGLRKLQSNNESVDVTVTVKADDQRTAVRLVRIPPLTRTRSYEARLRQLTYPDPLVRGIATISVALDEGMFSRAAEEASRLMDRVSDSPPLLEYLMAGLCQSGDEDAKGETRRFGPEDVFNRICAAGSARPQKPAEVAAPGAGEQPKPPDAPALPRNRTGIALLIGNSEYWGSPLNSVKNDVQGMRETLENRGFDVVVRENLKRAQDFPDALDRVLREEQATADDVLLVYYSGHGIQIDGRSYLLATGAAPTLRTVDEARGDAYGAEALLLRMEQAVPGTRILIVEACRDNPLAAPVSSGSPPVPNAGFAYTQEIPNTFVMFANKPGLSTPARSEYGLMGPFTEALIYAMNSSEGGLENVFEMAAAKTREISSGQEPDEHHSRLTDKILLRPRDPAVRDKRTKELLNAAEPLYRQRAWNELIATVERGRVLAFDEGLQRRFALEAEFARLARDAESDEKDRKWSEAAEHWQKAGDLVPARQWATMKSAVAWLLAGDLPSGVRALATVAARADADPAPQAKRMLEDFLKSFPALEAEAEKARQAAVKISTAEFETVKHEG